MYNYYKDIEDAFQELLKGSNSFYKIIDMREYMSCLHKDLHFTDSVLSENEYLRFKEFKYPKKKLQWLCGRLASKEALASYLMAKNITVDLKNIEVLYGEGGYPYFNNFEYLNLTISHSFPYCAAVLSDKLAGVDIEKVFEPTKAIIRHYFTDNEAILLDSVNLLEQKKLAGCMWSRKEALSKLLKKGLALNFKEIDTRDDKVVLMNRKVYLNTVIFDEHCISIAVEDEK
jgi:phosphopantetheinyl transferase